MSITSNQFKSTTVYGVFSNVDNSLNSILASAIFQGDVSFGGNITQSSGVGFNTLKDSFIGNIGQNVGSTIYQTAGTTSYNALNKSNFTGDLNINNGNLNLNNGNLTVTNGNIVSSIKQIGSSINNTLANCSITNSLTVAGVNYNTALALKSDLSYVNTNLALKVNITDLSYSTNTISTINNDLTINGNLDVNGNVDISNVLLTSITDYNSIGIINDLFPPTSPFVGSETQILTFNLDTNHSFLTLNINTPLSNQESGTLPASVSTISNRINGVSLFLYQNATLLQTITGNYTLLGTFNGYSPTGSSVPYSYQQYLGMVSGSFVIDTTTLNFNASDIFSVNMTITSQRLNIISGSSFGYIVNTTVSGRSSTGPITINQTRTGYVSPTYTNTQTINYSTDTGSIVCNQILSNSLYNQGVIDTGSINCNTNITTTSLATTSLTSQSQINSGDIKTNGLIQTIKTITSATLTIPELTLSNIYLLSRSGGITITLSNADNSYAGSIFYIRKISPTPLGTNTTFTAGAGASFVINVSTFTFETSTSVYFILLYGGSGIWYFLNF